MQPPKRVYCHGGKLGDVLYCLPALKALGGGELVLHPSFEMSIEAAIPLRPLLLKQSYIRAVRVEWCPRGTRLDTWRTFYCADVNLVQQHATFVRIGVNLKESWLSVDAAERASSVVFSRSSRHQNANFPWREVVAKYGDRAVFVGHRQEWANFTEAFGWVPYRSTSDFLELAHVIAGADLFIGNQSAPMALAVGLGVRYIQEVFKPAPNCIFPRPYCQHIRESVIDWDIADSAVLAGPHCERH